MREPLIGRCPSRALAAILAMVATPTLADNVVFVPGVGWEGQGADIVITNLDADPRPEMILMAYDNPAQANSFRYRLGKNLDPNGVAAAWNPGFIQVDGVGWEGQGAGAAVTNLDGDSRPELLLMAYDNPSGANTFRYRVGMNLDANGVAAAWNPGYIQVDGVGWEGQGADILITSLDSDTRPDMILMAYDNPAQGNSFRYRVGKNLDANGVAAAWNPGYIQVDGVGWEGQGAGAAIAYLDNDPRPELILMAYDNPGGQNNFRYKIGWNLDVNGVAASWSPLTMIDGLGWEGQGAGIAIHNLDGSSQPEMFLMAYDNPAQANDFRYRVLSNRSLAQGVRLEMDRFSSVNWLPSSVNRGGATYTFASIYQRAGMNVELLQDESLTDLHPGVCYSDPELAGLLSSSMNKPPVDANQWHMYGVLVTCYSSGSVLGIMFDTAQRRGFAEFMSTVTDNDRQLRTAAHELGHAFCLYHSDGDAWRASGPVAGQGRTIMNQTAVLASDWGYAWSAADLHTFYDKSKMRWGPRSGFAFGSCK